MLTAQTFFGAVLPAEGLFITARTDLTSDSHKVLHDTFRSKAAVTAYCDSHARSGQWDCWFAPAAYLQGWHEVLTVDGVKRKLRTRDNIRSLKALWLDIDVGEGKGYATREEAQSALAAFIRKVGLPRPYVVGSGKAGLHLYFAMEEEVSLDEWQDMADRLKQACKENGVAADHSRTTDAASVLRCPNTWNRKNGERHQVTLRVEGRVIPVAEMQRVLSVFTPAKRTYTQFKAVEIKVLPDLTTVDMAGLTARGVLDKYYALQAQVYPTRSAPELLRECEQLRAQKGASEPVWRGMLGVLRHAEHGRHVCHKVSAIDPRYNAEKTDEKLDYLEANDTPPFTCSYFREHRPEICSRCKHNGAITSPISVPKRVVEVVPAPQPAPPVDEVPSAPAYTQPASQGEQPSAAISTLGEKQILTDNSRVDNEGCFLRVKNVDGDYYWKKIHPYPVYPLQRIRGRTAKGETTVSYIFRKHKASGFDDIQISGGTLLGTGLSSALGECGFLLTEKEKKYMAALLVDILKATEETIGEVQTTDRLGWNDGHDTFLLGNKLYKSDGNVFEIAVAGKAKPFSDCTVPQGSLNLWRQIANVYNKEGLEWGQAVMASAFASPLMSLGALEKAALLFITGGKGVGKSTALMLAASVYGNPERLMFNKMDTANSRFHKLGIFSNITAAFDEMTDMSPKEASEFAYTLTQGRGKDRMGSGGEEMLLNTTYWSCLPVMSANDSIINALSQHGLDPTAQMSRVLEVQAADINKFYTKDEVEKNEKLVRQLPHNYGVAGDVYIRYVMAHKTEIMEMLFQIEKRFKEHAGLNSNHRFWTYMCTRMIVGTMVAKKLGLVDYDIARLFAYLVRQVQTAKADIEKYAFSPDDIVSLFLSDNIPYRIVVTHAKRPDGDKVNKNLGQLADINYVVQHPSPARIVHMRYELDTQQGVISKAAIRDWCKGKGISVGMFMKQLNAKYQVVRTRASRELGKDTSYSPTGKLDCVVVAIPKDDMSNETAD